MNEFSKTKFHLLVGAIFLLPGAYLPALPGSFEAEVKALHRNDLAREKCLDLSELSTGASNGDDVVQVDCDGKITQKWMFEKVQEPNLYQIKNGFSGKCLDVSMDISPYNGTQQGANVYQWDCETAEQNDENQLWYVAQNFEGYYKLVSKRSRRCLDVRAGSLENGATVHQLACEPAYKSQNWLIIPDILDADLYKNFDHKWALDLNKAREYFKNPTEKTRYFGVQTKALIPGKDPASRQIQSKMCAKTKEKIVIKDDDGNIIDVKDGDCNVWVHMQTRNYDHSKHVDKPFEKPIINIINNDEMIDPPGYLNIIAMFNAPVHQQEEIRKYLRNGDIIIYFHPDEVRMEEFQMHHAALYYETSEGPLALSLGTKIPYVHHLDNPVGYGPSFKTGATSRPFHVYRFNPNGAPKVGGRNAKGEFEFACNSQNSVMHSPIECQRGMTTFTLTNEMVDQYNYIARNWGFIVNSKSPFGDYHTLTWKDKKKRDVAGLSLLDEVDRFAYSAINYSRGNEMPETYCSGLVYTNINLALNRPLNKRAMGSELWENFIRRRYALNDKTILLGDDKYGVDSEYIRGSLLYSELMDTTDLPVLDRLIFEPLTSTDMIDALMDGYFHMIPSRQEKAQIIRSMAPLFAGSLSFYLQKEGNDPYEPTFDDYSGDRTKRMVMEYANAYVGGNEDISTIKLVEELVVENGREKTVLNLKVTPGKDGKEDLPSFKEFERKYLANRYIPPYAFNYFANKADSLISYVGTVIHADFLAPLKAGTKKIEKDVNVFSQGGPNTSFNRNMKVMDGGAALQRIFRVNSGPEKVGPGSVVTLKITASDARDLRAVLHPAGSFEPLDDIYFCDGKYGREGCPGGGMVGIPIPLPLPLSEEGDPITEWDDHEISSKFFDSVVNGGLGCEKRGDGRVLCPKYDWVSGGAYESEVYELGNARGQWVVTIIDRGDYARKPETTLPNCPECKWGGAQSNQWMLTIKNGDN